MPLNLVLDRSEGSVWDRSGSGVPWDGERWLTAILAGGFFIAGWRRRRAPTGVALMAAGGALAWWAALRPEVRRNRRAKLRLVRPSLNLGDVVVGEASEESFPASDAPSWTPTTGPSSVH